MIVLQFGNPTTAAQLQMAIQDAITNLTSGDGAVTPTASQAEEV